MELCTKKASQNGDAYSHTSRGKGLKGKYNMMMVEPSPLRIYKINFDGSIMYDHDRATLLSVVRASIWLQWTRVPSFCTNCGASRCVDYYLVCYEKDITFGAPYYGG